MKKHILLQCMVLAAILLLSACTGGSISPETTTAPQEPQADSGQMLKLSVHKDTENAQIFSVEELGGNFNRGLLYRRVKDVTIEVDGKKIPLETALAQGKITEEALWYYTQQDARNGFCQETWESRLGLSWVTFDYGDFSVVMAKDIYETPDGQQHLISSMKVHDPQNGKYSEPIYGSYYDEETYQRIDREDWGLTFTVSDPSPSGLSVQCRQSGGQQIGQLIIGWYIISNQDGFIPNLAGTGESPGLDHPVEMNGETTFTINWLEEYGELPSGKYQIDFSVLDEFEESQVHPLMRDYHDWQYYILEFTIP